MCEQLYEQILEFEYLNELEVDCSILTIKDEKSQIVPDDADQNGWKELFYEKVIMKFRSGNNEIKANKFFSYWDAYKVISYKSLKNKKILKIGDKHEATRTQKQFEIKQKEYDNNYEVVFDGSEEVQFKEFFHFACEHIRGDRPKQKTRPLYQWKKEKDIPLVNFFISKLDARDERGWRVAGWSNDFLDKKINDMDKMLLKGAEDVKAIMKLIHERIDNNIISCEEYLSIMLRLSGITPSAYKNFFRNIHGLDENGIRNKIKAAIPKVAECICKVLDKNNNEKECVIRFLENKLSFNSKEC